MVTVPQHVGETTIRSGNGMITAANHSSMAVAVAIRREIWGAMNICEVLKQECKAFSN
jgi:hypothetical protein